MFAGMGVFSGLTALVFAAVGTSFGDQADWFRVVLMGINMTVPMVLWMTWRGHPPARNLEMAASMLFPTLLAAGLVAAGLVGRGSGMLIQHLLMLPGMLIVMLWRYEEYASGHHHGVTAEQ
ncbi:hypothetical protein GCM10009780_14600 [Actinomadura alba]